MQQLLSYQCIVEVIFEEFLEAEDFQVGCHRKSHEKAQLPLPLAAHRQGKFEMKMKGKGRKTIRIFNKSAKQEANIRRQ